MAWLSTPGFHCSSMMKTRLAQVRFSLGACQHHICSSPQGLAKAANVPKSTGASRHDEHSLLVVFGELVELGLSLRGGTTAVDAEIGNPSFVEVLGQQVQRPRPAGEDNTILR